MKNKIVQIVVVVSIICFIFAACTTAPQAPAPAAEEANEVVEEITPVEEAVVEEEQLLIAAVAAESGIPYFTTMHCGAQAAAEKYNIDLFWDGPAEWDFNKQQPFIDGALALNPDGMIIVPTDPDALVAFVSQWMDDGIPVISVDVTLSEPVELQGIESDQYSGGVAAAEAMFAATGGEGSYLPVGTTPGSFGANQRVAGFVDTMKKLNSEVKILETCFPHHDATKAAECVSAAIIGNQDLRGVFVATSAPASGASSAIIESGKAGEVLLTSFDADPQQIQDLKAGIYEFVIAQDPYWMGYHAVEILVQYLRGEVDANDVEQKVFVPMAALTKDNVDDLDLQKFHYVGDMSLCPPPPSE